MRLTSAFAAILAILAFAVPVSADPAVATNEPCTNTAGKTVITLDSGFNDTVETPVGALNFTGTVDAGTYVIDLAGLEEGVKKNVDLVLSWDNPAADYDLVVNGVNDLSSASPEAKGVNARHCQIVSLETDVFYGLPIDTLNLSVSIQNFNF